MDRSLTAQTTAVTVPGPKNLILWKENRGGLPGSSRLLLLLLMSAFSMDAAQHVALTTPAAWLKQQLSGLLQYFRK